MTFQSYFTELFNVLAADRAMTKALAAMAALALLCIVGMQLRHGLRKGRWVTASALVLVVAVSIAGYFEFGRVRYGTFMNNHDFYHYYTGTKYAPELGYFNQYAASLLADQEQDKVFDTSRSIRNLENHGYTPTREVFENQDAIKGRFSPERWEDFKSDIAYFKGRVPAAKWQQMLRDKGYNGTPVWTMVTGTLTNLVDTDNDQGMFWLQALDPLILAAMFAAIWWAFGPWTALFALAFFGTNFVTNFVHIKGALLRMDWVAGLVISMCLLHKKHFKTAGIVLAYAAAARVFPAIFAFGLGALACWELFATRKINRDYLRFFLSFFITAGLLVGAAYIYYGSALWGEFVTKIAQHNSDISTTRVGFKYIFLWPFHSFGEKVDGFRDNQHLWWQIQAVMLVIAFFAARKMKPYQALGFGFVPAFFLTAPTFYYYIHLVVLLLVFLPDLQKRSNVIGASLLFVTSIAAYVMNKTWNLDFPLCFYLSCMYGAICVYLTGLYLLPSRVFQTAATTTPVSEDLSKEVAPEVVTASPHGSPALSIAAKRPPSWRARALGIAYFALIVWLFLNYRTAPELEKTSEARTPAAPISQPGNPAVEKKADAPLVTDSTARPTRPTATEKPDISTMPAEKSIAPEVTPAPRAADGETITLALVGDIMLSRNVAKDLAARNLDFTYPFEATAPMLQTADLAFGNLECPISGRGEALDKKYIFNAPPESVAGLVSGGFDIVSLANNHTLDYGTVALEDTVRILTENGIPGAGISENDGPQEPVVLERKGIWVGFLAYADHETPYAYAKEFLPFEKGPVKAIKESIARDVKALQSAADIIVISLHWGIEYEDDPNERQIDLGQFCIDLGADIVAGHHPHVQQDAAWYKDGLIIYSMGNFVFDQWSRPKTRESRLYTVTLNKTGPVHAQYRPLEIIKKDWQPRPTGPRYVPVLRNQE